MLAPLTSLSPHGLPFGSGEEGLVPPIGPVVTLAFVLPLAGPAPNVIEPPVPQSCQNSSANVALQVLVVDQAGAPVDLSAATGLQFWLLAPDSAPRAVVAEFVSNGMDGMIFFVASAADLPETGLWEVQAQLTFETTVMTTRWGKFWVGPNVVDL